MPKAELPSSSACSRTAAEARRRPEMVAEELTEHDALAAHLALELGIDRAARQPVGCGGLLGGLLTIGALLPLLAVIGPSERLRIPAFVAVLVALTPTGAVQRPPRWILEGAGDPPPRRRRGAGDGGRSGVGELSRSPSPRPPGALRRPKRRRGLRLGGRSGALRSPRGRALRHHLGGGRRHRRRSRRAGPGRPSGSRGGTTSTAPHGWLRPCSTPGSPPAARSACTCTTAEYGETNFAALKFQACRSTSTTGTSTTSCTTSLTTPTSRRWCSTPRSATVCAASPSGSRGCGCWSRSTTGRPPTADGHGRPSTTRSSRRCRRPSGSPRTATSVYIFYTGGTTGMPKGVMYPLRGVHPVLPAVVPPMIGLPPIDDPGSCRHR